MNSTRYIGDVLFDLLDKNPGFREEARKLITVDWRTGTDSFRQYVNPLLDYIFAAGDLKGWGDVDHSYLARRAMEGITEPHQDPWLWAYATLTGAHEDPDVVRAALDGIKRSA